MSRPSSRLAALVALFALLFAQVAVSAYACPREGPPVAHHAQMPDGTPCDMDDNSNLCTSHCDYGNASVGPLDFDFPAPVLDTSRVLLVAPVDEARAVAPRSLRAPRSHSPPPLLLFGALRI